VQLTEAEHRAFAVWLANNGTKASKHLAQYIRKTIGMKQLSPLRVGEMHESDNSTS
jgi:hypothetical protein